MNYLFSYGLPYSEKLENAIISLVERVEGNKASLLIIDGGVGEGKTTLAIHIADDINKMKGLPPLNLEEKEHIQYAMGGEDFLGKMRQCYEEDLPVIIYDEAGDFNRRSALTRFNSMLNRTFETFRGFKIVVILCLPSVDVLDRDLFDKNIPRMLLHVYGRSNKYGNLKAYSLYNMMWIKEKMKKLVVKHYAYGQINANLFGHFLNLPPDRAKKLDNISTKGKIDILKKSELKIEGLMGYSEMAKKLNRSVIWVKKYVAKLKLKHEKIIKNTKYFKGEDIINRLSEEIDNNLGGRT